MFTNDTSEFTQSYIHVKKCHISSWCMCALKTCFTRVWYCANNIVTQHCITPVLFGFSSKSYNQMPGGLIILNDKSKQQYSLNRVREIHSCSSNWSQQIALSCLRALKILQYTVIWEWWNDKTDERVFISKIVQAAETCVTHIQSINMFFSLLFDIQSFCLLCQLR